MLDFNEGTSCSDKLLSWQEENYFWGRGGGGGWFWCLFKEIKLTHLSTDFNYETLTLMVRTEPRFHQTFNAYLIHTYLNSVHDTGR